MNLAVLLAALVLALPLPAAAQESPEAVYARFHRALQAGNVDELNRYGTPGGGAELTKMSPAERKTVLDLMKKFVPATYSITGRDPSPDPNRAYLRATGMGTSLFTGKPEAATGMIVMHKLGGEWKVDQANWNSGNKAAAPPPVSGGTVLSPAPSTPIQNVPIQSAPAPAAQAASTKAASKPPAPAARPAQQPCVYKSVMTNEDLERCR